MDGQPDLIERITDRLLSHPTEAAGEAEVAPHAAAAPKRTPIDAAVLIGLVRRRSGYGVLYTERSAQLRSHAGEVAFPGGKIDPLDDGANDAALREAVEEVGLVREEARTLGYLPRYLTATNYLITPVVAVIEPTRPFVPNPSEVTSVFEMPVERLLDARAYGTYRVRIGGTERTTWRIVHEELTIWGITAALTRRFRDLVVGGEDGD